MSPEQQQHLKQNLSLKVQLALWAASERKADIYQKTLTDIQQWLTEFFDMKNVANQHVEQALIKLQQQRVSYDYPSELTSLAAIRTVLTKQQIKPLPQPSISSLPEPTPTENKAKKEQQIDVDVDVDNQETKLEQNSQSINEDNI
jgi:uroporphyrin-3 C-methyltransferase